MNRTNVPQVTSAEVVAIRPELADERRMRFLHEDKSAGLPSAMYVVKVYLREGLTVSGAGAALYLGDEWIRKYFEFPGGIFFNVYDTDFFQRHAGEMIRFTTDHETFHDSGVRLPGPSREIVAAIKAESADLPSKKEALNR